MPENIDVFVICSAGTIAPGQAKAFMLARIDEAGENRPFPIFVLHTAANGYLGYVNICPHNGSLLNSAAGGFLSQDRKFLECGLHGAKFEINTGLCVDGPCAAKSLEPIAIAVIDGDICLCGVKLAEDDGIPDPFTYEEKDDIPEVLIQSDY
jgi:nitrite reductase/ring-hydroxylating ferredoxin subunit